MRRLLSTLCDYLNAASRLEELAKFGGHWSTPGLAHPTGALRISGGRPLGRKRLRSRSDCALPRSDTP